MRKADIYVEITGRGPGRQKRRFGYVLETPQRPGSTGLGADPAPFTREGFGTVEGTENQATLTALIEAAGRFRTGCCLTIHTGDRFVANMIAHNLDAWAGNAFCRGGGKPLANRGLWILLHQLLRSHQVMAVAGKHGYSEKLQKEMEERHV